MTAIELITGHLRRPLYHPTTGWSFPNGFAGARWFAVELHPSGWHQTPSRTRAEARRLVAEARQNGTPSWVLDAWKGPS